MYSKYECIAAVIAMLLLKGQVLEVRSRLLLLAQNASSVIRQCTLLKKL